MSADAGTHVAPQHMKAQLSRVLLEAGMPGRARLVLRAAARSKNWHIVPGEWRSERVVELYVDTLTAFQSARGWSAHEEGEKAREPAVHWVELVSDWPIAWARDPAIVAAFQSLFGGGIGLEIVTWPARHGTWPC
jgi:hypothetical protein